MHIPLRPKHRLDDIFSTVSYTILSARPYKRGLPMLQYSNMARGLLSSQCSDMSGSKSALGPTASGSVRLLLIAPLLCGRSLPPMRQWLKARKTSELFALETEFVDDSNTSPGTTQGIKKSTVHDSNILGARWDPSFGPRTANHTQARGTACLSQARVDHLEARETHHSVLRLASGSASFVLIRSEDFCPAVPL